MPVDTLHPDYVAQQGNWLLMRAVAAGQKAIHAGGTAYLPKLSKETDTDYAARKARATFFNATWRTIEGLTGMLFRKAPERKGSSAAIEEMFKDITKSGVELDELAGHVAEELMIVGRAGILVDYPKPVQKPDGTALTVADAEAMNLRPHKSLYKTESIINWSTEWINNRTRLSRVVLAEKIAKPDPADEFATVNVEQWRVLDLVGGQYRQRVIIKVAGAEVTVEEFFPLLNGAPLPHIPFQIYNSDGLSPAASDPPLLDLAYVNLSHYHTTADVEHGAHKTALPQPYICGVNLKTGDNGEPLPDQSLYLGGGAAWVFPDPNTTVGMLEYSGKGLESLETRLEKKEQQMAVLGARMLEQQKKAQEAAETAGIHRSGEQSSLAKQARVISRGFRNTLEWFDTWAGGSGVVVYEISRDFFPLSMSAQELTALVAAWQQGAMSKEALFEKLQKAEVISDARKFEDEEAKIENAPPTLLAQAAAAPEQEPGADDE